MLHSILSNDRKLFDEYKRIVCESYLTSDNYHESLEEYQRLENQEPSWIIDIAKATCKLALFGGTVIEPCLEGLLFLLRNKYQDYQYVENIEIPNKFLDPNLKHIYQKLVEIESYQRKVIIANIECQPHIQSMLHEALNEQDYPLFRNIIFNNGINTKGLSKMLLVSDLFDYSHISKLEINEREQVFSIYKDIFLTTETPFTEFMSMFFKIVMNMEKSKSVSLLDGMVLLEHIVMFQTLFLLILINANNFSEDELEVIVQQLRQPEFNEFNDGFKELVKEFKLKCCSNTCNLFLTKIFNTSNSEVQKLLGIESSFSLLDNYFELEPEKDESLYLGAKDSAIITTEGVESFIKLINFIVDNNYVKAAEEHSTLNDLKYDLAFKLTGKMRPNILCPKIIWTNSDYTNPLIAIAKGLGGNYDKIKDLFIIDSSYHNRLASIYAERLHIGDKFTNFFYELYPKMNNKVKKVKKNNKAD